jgi:hypothetical protein
MSLSRCPSNRQQANEHIWPQALGGDPLSSFWRTNDVCAQCNSMSGVFVDGAFIRGWAGSAERTHDTNQYLSLDDPTKSAPPPNYLGQLNHRAIRPNEVVDWWVGPCGATILHFRPKETEALWSSYVGGDPRPNRTKPGRAYIALASENEYWLVSALVSFKNHFKRDARFLVNLTAPPEWSAFQNVDRKHAEQAADLIIFDSITDAAKAGKSVPARQEIRTDIGHRFLCKLGLAIGCQLLGPEFTLLAAGGKAPTDAFNANDARELFDAACDCRTQSIEKKACAHRLLGCVVAEVDRRPACPVKLLQSID